MSTKQNSALFEGTSGASLSAGKQVPTLCASAQESSAALSCKTSVSPAGESTVRSSDRYVFRNSPVLFSSSAGQTSNHKLLTVCPLPASFRRSPLAEAGLHRTPKGLHGTPKGLHGTPKGQDRGGIDQRVSERERQKEERFASRKDDERKGERRKGGEGKSGDEMRNQSEVEDDRERRRRSRSPSRHRSERERNYARPSHRDDRDRDRGGRTDADRDRNRDRDRYRDEDRHSRSRWRRDDEERREGDSYERRGRRDRRYNDDHDCERSAGERERYSRRDRDDLSHRDRDRDRNRERRYEDGYERGREKGYRDRGEETYGKRYEGGHHFDSRREEREKRDRPPVPYRREEEEDEHDEVEEKEEEFPQPTTFDEMGLKESLLRGIFSHGFEKPVTIQQKAIPRILSGRDTIAQAQSGTGKTGAFVISSLQRLKDPTTPVGEEGGGGINRRGQCQVVIMAPTRELAEQIYDVTRSMSQHMEGVFCPLCVGGTELRGNIAALKRGCQIVIGTPGRLIQLIEKGYVETTGVTLLVMDEADKMLGRDFKDQVKDIFRSLPKDVQVALFSATMPRETVDFARRFMRDPLRILVKRDQLTLEGIRQWFVIVENPDQKVEVLLDLYAQISITQSVIFCNSILGVKRLAQKMDNDGHSVSVIHAELTGEERRGAMRDFALGRSRVLAATDVLARGIDVQGVSVVVNMELPLHKETYLHRIGRSGRLGRKGVAISLLVREEMRQLKEIERFYGTQVEEMPSDFEKYFQK
uniref:RNA helicase n=1 Tax=Chromera velia CCMP2878 TaxID=1169474 RepID=A0A0G4HK96_9ALVE|eukprot:Cvel_28395.t1-p1 / transcript=Cvel_28395.t1 / gene=Cvel_28395 / organism=Chromera_velia_CCMP2878 / gene_product=Eukaryotic initiation factor 4A, putative / transcript_product=Eukaryotic initiation factor 4A, putative / location=Cvel_scaffold3709:9902-12172(-) / protein_length=757 / sequence_SO=supercontig / SO=protein_coding / is_pseudo=false